ncbi:MAG: 4-hydroxy-tetrahydrodipicolinate reductase [Holosporales bacterium]
MRVAVAGCLGRMGRLIVQQVQSTPTLLLSACTVSPKSDCVGQDIGTCFGAASWGVIASTRAEDLFQDADGIIDFTTPELTAQHLELVQHHPKPLVIGTTGLTPEHHELLQRASQVAPILYAANYSVGITLLRRLVKQAAQYLGATDFDVDILEKHHRYKMDAPSGTALALGQSVAEGRNEEFQDLKCLDRTRRVESRSSGEIGFAVVRAGGIVGEHDVIFASSDEVVTLSHQALSRNIFAVGAVRALLWLHHKPPGLYSMDNVLGFGD